MKMEGIIIVSPSCSCIFLLCYKFYFYAQGFDEYMNVVLDDAVEINVKASTRKQIGSVKLFT